jgi:alpha-amylase
MPLLPRLVQICIAAAFLTGLAPGLSAQTSGNSLWQRQSIYQIVTDRFFDGDPSNNNADGNYDPAGHSGVSVHGGDFKGIEKKLDYIKALGATAIWISPVVLNARGEFHGYAGRDFYKVDPHWGTLEDLQHMVRAAHDRGILVIDDIVVNHGGDLVDSSDPGYPNFNPAGYQLRFRHASKQYPPPFDLNATNPALANLFHNYGCIQNYSDPQQVQLGELSGLDDFRTESPYVREQMEKIYEYWIATAGFDGFRIDTVQHVEMGFWETWCPAIHDFAAAHGKPDFFMFGEVLNRSDAKCASYVGAKNGGPFKLDSVLDYPLYFKINSVFARGTGNTRQIEDRYKSLATNYDSAAQMQLVTFLDNHDQPRFLSPDRADNHVDRLKTALVFLYTTRGIPCLYYGTEQGFNGRTDPYDREDMFAGQFEFGPSLGDNFDMTHPLFQTVARLNNFRRLYPALLSGTQVNLWSTPDGPGLLAYARRLGQQEIVVVINTSNAAQALPPRPTLYPPGTRLVNLFDPSDTVTVGADAQLPPISVPGAGAKIFIAATQALPLDPVVTQISPAHDSKDVETNATVAVQFSEPMDTDNVQAAFSTIPAVPGTFAWSATKDKLTFTPQGSGFPPQTMVTVRIANTARTANGNSRFFSAFDSRFKTAN